jgi:hypothetical protein
MEAQPDKTVAPPPRTIIHAYLIRLLIIAIPCFVTQAISSPVREMRSASQCHASGRNGKVHAAKRGQLMCNERLREF